MHWFKKTFVFGEDSNVKENIVFWKRQMDDVFFIWKGMKEEPEPFKKLMRRVFCHFWMLAYQIWIESWTQRFTGNLLTQ
jgi:hypothetical protein